VLLLPGHLLGPVGHQTRQERCTNQEIPHPLRNPQVITVFTGARHVSGKT